MTKIRPIGAAIAALALLAACSNDSDPAAQTDTATRDAATAGATEASSEMDASSASADQNPLLAEWTGPYQGVPAFDTMSLEHLTEAVEIGMARQLKEIEAIASNEAAPTFENTIVAMERAGDDLGRVFTYWGI